MDLARPQQREYSDPAVEIQFKQVVIGAVPLPAQLPPAPFPAADLHQAYVDVSAVHPYQQFQMLPGESGAHFLNSLEDGVLIQPGLLQVRHSITSETTGSARQESARILAVLVERLRVQSFLAVGIKVVAHAPVTHSARDFIAGKLMKNGEQTDQLGPDFFAAGLTYVRLGPNGQPEQTVLIQPFIQDDTYLFLDYDVQRQQPTDVLEHLPDWLDEAFKFVQGPVLHLLEKGA